MASTLEINIDLWSSSHPKEAVILNHLQVSKTVSQENLDNWFPLNDLEGIELLFVYGVGLGEGFQQGISWLKESQERRLIFLEDDLELIYRFFETTVATELLQNPQVDLVFFQDLDSSRAALLDLFWQYFQRPFSVIAIPSYEQKKAEEFSNLSHEIHYTISQLQGSVEEYLRFGVTFFRNYYPNTLKLPQSHLGNRFFGKFKGVPAIICGAGPSLEKQYAKLPELKEKALIFAGGSALNALHSIQLPPHFGAAIDPNPTQYERHQQLKEFNIPVFYRSRLYHKALNAIQGPRLYVTGAGGYDIAAFVERKLGIPSVDLEEGHNVLNFAIQIAELMGCNPIILVGMDLAYTGMCAYAPGVVDDPHVAKESITKSVDLNEQAVPRPSITGETVYTHWKWIAESRFVTQFAKEHPNTTILNASEGGIGFEGISNVSLNDIPLEKTIDLNEKIQSVLKESTLPKVTEEKVRTVLVDLSSSLERCVHHLQVMIDELSRVKMQLEFGGEVDTIETGQSTLAEVELAEEEAFNAILSDFNLVVGKLMQGEIQKIRAFGPDQSERFKTMIALGEKKYRFLQQAASANIQLIESSLKGEFLG